MKQKDIALIVAAAVFAGILSIVIARFVFATPSDHQQEAEVVDPISTEFDLPSSQYFNSNSINPTELIRISDNSNQTPFNGDTAQ